MKNNSVEQAKLGTNNSVKHAELGANNSRKRAESETKLLAPKTKLPLLDITQIPQPSQQPRVRSLSQQGNTSVNNTYRYMSASSDDVFKNNKNPPISAERVSSASMSSRSGGESTRSNGDSSSVGSLDSPKSGSSGSASSDKIKFTKKGIGRSLKGSSHTGFFNRSPHSNLKQHHEPSAVKSYSFEKILNKRTLNLDYLKSFSTQILKGYYTETANEYAQNFKEKNGYIIKAFLNESKASKNNTNDASNAVEVLYIKQGDTVEAYLFHKDKFLGEKNGNGSVFIAYQFPDLTGNIKDIYPLMISKAIAIKTPSSSLGDSEISAIVNGLKANKQYINHCTFDGNKEVYFLMNYINGPNMLDCVYDKTLNKKRYLTPEIILQFDLQLFDCVNEFNAAKFLHRDIKLENAMVKPKPNPTTFDIFLIDTDDAVPITQKTININGSPGYPKLEINPNANFPRDFYTSKTDRLLLGWTLAAIGSTNNHHLQVTNLLSTKPRQSDYTHKDMCSITPDILMENPPLIKDKPLIEIFRAHKIDETWIQLPIDTLFSYVAESLENFVPEDIELLKNNKKDLIDLIVYRLYIAPFRNLINVRLTMDNPDLRPNDHELPQIHNEMQNILIMYQQLAHRYNIRYDLAHQHMEAMPNLLEPFDELMDLEKNSVPKAQNYNELYNAVYKFIKKTPVPIRNNSSEFSSGSLGKTINNSIVEEDAGSASPILGKK